MPRVAHASPQGRRLCPRARTVLAVLRNSPGDITSALARDSSAEKGRAVCPTRQLHIMCQHLRPHDTLLQFRGRVVARVMRLREFRRRSRGLSEHRCITSPRPG